LQRAFAKKMIRPHAKALGERKMRLARFAGIFAMVDGANQVNGVVVDPKQPDPNRITCAKEI
jgi:hypothetical protein